MSCRQYILDEIDDQVSRFVYYDRKGDEVLPCGAIEDAVASGEITVDEIVHKFEKTLRKSLEKELFK